MSAAAAEALPLFNSKTLQCFFYIESNRNNITATNNSSVLKRRQRNVDTDSGEDQVVLLSIIYK